MSQLVGQYGSVLPNTYVQPMQGVGPNDRPPLASAYGNFLGSGVPSLGADDPARQRPTAYVLPRQIELMEGFFDHDYNGVAEVGAQPVTYSTSSIHLPVHVNQSLRSTAYKTKQPATSEAVGVYGLPYTSMSERQCANDPSCTVTNSGACRCPGGTTFFISKQT